MFRNPIILSTIGIIIVCVSVYADWGLESWYWFQRSGSLLVLLGALMEIRSIMRLGVKGVGGQDISILKGKVVNIDNSDEIQKVDMVYDRETTNYLYQAALDKISGYIGAIFLILGTVIWGYGDLAGKVIK